MIGSGLDVQGVRRDPIGIGVFAVNTLAVVEVVGGGCGFGLSGSSALVVVLVAGRRCTGDLRQLVEAVPTVLTDDSSSAGAVAGSGDACAGTFLGLLARVVVEVRFQQCAGEVGLPDFGELVGSIEFIGNGGGDRVAELFLHPVAEGVVGVALPLGAIVDLGQAVERVVLVGIGQRGLAGQGFLVGFASAQAVVAVHALREDGGGVFMRGLF